MRQRNALPVSVRLLLMLPLVACMSCQANHVTRTIAKPDQYFTLDSRSPYLKVHYNDGRIQILDDWKAYPADGYLYGHGVMLDANRDVISTGYDTVRLASVALLESNVVESGTIVPEMTVFTGLSLALSIYCLLTPKACFGSCPTFYAWDGSRYTLMAEGFSSSVLPTLEANDIDALYTAVPRSRTFDLRMTNEAYETHLVRSADLLVCPRPPGGGRILHMSDGSLRQASLLMPPSRCTAPEGDVLKTLVSFDTLERFSCTDSNDLESKEDIDLVFDASGTHHLGLTLGFRQTLLTTYLFYQGLAYLGDSAAAMLSRMQSHPDAYRGYLDPFGTIFGGIEVLAQDSSGTWHRAGSFYETGPIAHNVQTVALPDEIAFNRHVRLRMTKGMWRLNYVALAVLGPTVTPIRIKPSLVLKDSVAQPAELAILRTGSGHVVSMPSDVRILRYDLPDAYGDLDLFLDARGYYIEWMRQEWLAETDPAKAAMMFLFPHAFLRMEAPRFKSLESSLENSFWSSRYVRRDQ